MLQRKVFVSFILVIMTVSLIACGNSNNSKKSQDGFLDFLTGDPDGTWAAIGTGISDKLNKNLDSVEISSKPGPGSVGNPEAVSNGNGDIGMSYNPFLIKAINGEEPYSKDRKSTRLNSSHVSISYAVFCLKK